jgi:hypothetical protein
MKQDFRERWDSEEDVARLTAIVPLVVYVFPMDVTALGGIGINLKSAPVDSSSMLDNKLLKQ